MDKKSKILVYIFFSLIVIVVVFTFYKFIIAKDYYIRLETTCEPTKEHCFVNECNPEEEECPADPAEGISYYKIIEEKASAIPDCSLSGEECPEIFCAEGEDCQEIFCDPETNDTGIECVDLEEFIILSEVPEDTSFENVDLTSSSTVLVE
ncbi:MAG TPA: hypothetical protein DEB09_05510 [Candidatus Magasanikbacteria bacterium]|nr:hypothetical protein [Candidatus Magasanikbacteria bacterium]